MGFGLAHTSAGPLPASLRSILGPEISSTQTQYRLGNLTASVAKGATRLPVTTAGRFREGQWVRLWATNPTGRPAQAANPSSSGSAGWRRQRRLLGIGRAVGELSRQLAETRQLSAADNAAGMQDGGAPQDGSLDAYLYGNIPSAGATGERR